ncbi:MAG: hypothetical protein ACE5ID_00240, partial [Acidobacteriota bacterium]
RRPPPPSPAPGGGTPFQWKEGLIEVNRYTFKEKGTRVGEIEQRLYGVKGEKNRPVFKVIFELIRQARMKGKEPLVGRSTTEILFDPETLDLLSKSESYSIADTEARIRISKTPTGFRTTQESYALGSPRPPEVKELTFEADTPLVDQMVVGYMVRKMAGEEGRTFSLNAINPVREGILHLKGKVGRIVPMELDGHPMEAWRVDVASPKGTTTYYVQPGEERSLLRYVASNGEVYELQNAGGSRKED